jgi:hypothetical protein
MNWRLPQPLLVPLLLLLCRPSQGTPLLPPVDSQPPGNSSAAAPPPGAVLPGPSEATPPPAVLPPTGSVGSPLPVPTDQTPPEIALPSPIPLGESLLVSGAVDGRYRTSNTGRTDQAWLNEAEVDLNRPFTHDGSPIGNIHIQVVAENPPDAPTAQDLLLGEAYAMYKLPFQTQTDSTVYLKLGQFQLPFGLLAVSDPHLQILQPLYAQSIGLRTDFGAEVSGRFYGVLNYDISLTSGNGPDHIDIKTNPVVTFRLGRTFVTRNGTVNVGGSLLQGQLPNTDLSDAYPDALELPPSGYVRADRGFTSKTRIAGDGTITFKNITGRGEAMVGADDNSRVEGYYVEADYRFTPRANVTLARAVWDYPQNTSISQRSAIGLTYVLDANLSFSTLYEDLYDSPPNLTGRTRHQLTFQALLRF